MYYKCILYCFTFNVKTTLKTKKKHARTNNK